MRKCKVSILASISIVLLVLYAIDWEFDDNLSHFALFVVGVLLVFLVFICSVVQIIFFKNYQTIVVLLLLSLFFVLPLKQYYVVLDYRLNKEKREKIVQLYREGKLSKTSQKLYDGIDIYSLPNEYNSVTKDKKVIYVHEQCIAFPLFHHLQMLLYCSDPHEFLKKYHYSLVSIIDDGRFWITEKTSSEIKSK